MDIKSKLFKLSKRNEKQRALNIVSFANDLLADNPYVVLSRRLL